MSGRTPGGGVGSLPSARMDRIAILGSGGSGKTYLAHQLAALLDLPLIHLDAVYYDRDWTPRPAEDFAARQRDLVAAPRWLIEGNYAGTLAIRAAAADTVVFLDVHPLVCLAGIAQRRCRYGGGQHTDGVYDRITWGFVRYIWGYRTTMRPRVRELLDEHAGGARLVTLTGRRHTSRWLDQIRAELAQST